MEDMKKLTETELEQVSGGKIDPEDYLYETTVNKETPFYKAISMTPENYKVWFDAAPGVHFRVREEDCVDWLGKVYVRCFTRIDKLEEGYILQSDIVRKTY